MSPAAPLPPAGTVTSQRKPSLRGAHGTGRWAQAPEDAGRCAATLPAPGSGLVRRPGWASREPLGLWGGGLGGGEHHWCSSGRQDMQQLQLGHQHLAGAQRNPSWRGRPATAPPTPAGARGSGWRRPRGAGSGAGFPLPHRALPPGAAGAERLNNSPNVNNLEIFLFNCFPCPAWGRLSACAGAGAPGSRAAGRAVNQAAAAAPPPPRSRR